MKEENRDFGMLKRIVDITFYLSILFFIIALNFQDNKFKGWSLQIQPYGPVSDVFFTDSLTGYLVTNNNTPLDTGYIVKTTNGGANWNVVFKNIMDLSKITFINSNTGFTCGGNQSGTPYFYKTTNAGNNWNLVNAPYTAFFDGMSVLNNDTIWLADGDGLVGGIFRTTNGGQSWIQQLYAYNYNPDKIYMVNKNFGFISRDQSYTGRTTNGGFNWSITTEDSTFRDIVFVDSLIGYRSFVNVKKTTNGGLSWFSQILPNVIGSTVNVRTVLKFSAINKDTVYGVGGWIEYPNLQDRCIIYKTTNGGINWGYQIPDTSFKIPQLWNVSFVNNLIGWAFRISTKDIHTTTGGDTTIITKVENNNLLIVNNFELKQNYPNPFNAISNIKYKISKRSYIKIKIFDINGKEIIDLINKKQNEGRYEVKFDGGNLSSGVYFYSLYADGVRVDTKKMVLIK
jgi:photosystem II stability/assembly factor-like uncharacterized protein